MTIDAIQGCTLGCSYCSIQTFYSDGKVAVETNLADKLNELELKIKKNFNNSICLTTDFILEQST